MISDRIDFRKKYRDKERKQDK